MSQFAIGSQSMSSPIKSQSMPAVVDASPGARYSSSPYLMQSPGPPVQFHSPANSFSSFAPREISRGIGDPSPGRMTQFEEEPVKVVKLEEVPPSTYTSGCCSLAGAKPNMPNWVNQDSYLEMNLVGGHVLVGVFDGHGPNGTHISNRVKSLFADRAAEIEAASDSIASFLWAFADVDLEIRKDSLAMDSGATVTLALIDTLQHRACIAHVGDSTALLVDAEGRIVFQSRDHKPSDEIEAGRLKAHGSNIINGRLYLTGNSQIHFGLSRSIGDYNYSPQGVSAEPEIADGLQLQPGSALILASDGVWDMASKEYVSNVILQSSPQDAAEIISTTARDTWQASAAAHIDDITAIVVRVAAAESSLTKTTSYIKRMLDGSLTSSSTAMPDESPRISESSGSGHATPISCGNSGLSDFMSRMRFFSN